MEWRCLVRLCNRAREGMLEFSIVIVSVHCTEWVFKTVRPDNPVICTIII